MASLADQLISLLGPDRVSATQGRCYGVKELEQWAAECGFGEFHYQDTAAARGILTAKKS